MALPKLLQKLFADEGKGPKLNPSIIPTKINGQEPDETGEFKLQLSDPDAATRPEILTAVKKVTESSEVTFEPDASVPSVGHNIGEEWVSYTGVIPFGGIPYCGQEVTRETYRDLWEYAQTQGLVKSESEWQSIASAQNGNVAFYSTGDGSTTFRMPSIKGYVKGASSQSETGEYIAEGLPNITGSMRSDPDYGIVDNADKETCLNGAFAGGERVDNGAAGSKDIYGAEVIFDASRSNPIYGNSDHVTPETSVVMFGVYAFGEITNQGALDATTLATGLARVESNVGGLETNKLDKAIVHIVETWKNGTSWYRKYSDGWIEQGGKVSMAEDNNPTITFQTPFTATPNVTFGWEKNDSLTDSSQNVTLFKISTTGFRMHQGMSTTIIGHWYACGY